MINILKYFVEMILFKYPKGVGHPGLIPLKCILYFTLSIYSFKLGFIQSYRGYYFLYVKTVS